MRLHVALAARDVKGRIAGSVKILGHDLFRTEGQLSTLELAGYFQTLSPTAYSLRNHPAHPDDRGAETMSFFDLIETMLVAGPPDEEPRTSKVWGKWALWIVGLTIIGWGIDAVVDRIWH
jgi:hypothetical protein